MDVNSPLKSNDVISQEDLMKYKMSNVINFSDKSILVNSNLNSSNPNLFKIVDGGSLLGSLEKQRQRLNKSMRRKSKKMQKTRKVRKI